MIRRCTNFAPVGGVMRVTQGDRRAGSSVALAARTRRLLELLSQVAEHAAEEEEADDDEDRDEEAEGRHGRRVAPAGKQVDWQPGL